MSLKQKAASRVARQICEPRSRYLLVGPQGVQLDPNDLAAYASIQRH